MRIGTQKSPGVSLVADFVQETDHLLFPDGLLEHVVENVCLVLLHQQFSTTGLGFDQATCLVNCELVVEASKHGALGSISRDCIDLSLESFCDAIRHRLGRLCVHVEDNEGNPLI